jgi:hypothetical protein
VQQWFQEIPLAQDCYQVQRSCKNSVHKGPTSEQIDSIEEEIFGIFGTNINATVFPVTLLLFVKKYNNGDYLLGFVE